MNLGRFVLLIFLLAALSEGNRKFLEENGKIEIVHIRSDLVSHLPQHAGSTHSRSPPPPKSTHHKKPHKAPPSSHSAKQTKSDIEKNKKVVAAAVSGAVVLLAILCCCCCCRCCRKSGFGSSDGKRDERPLLNICPSDVSGSSHKSQSIGHSSSNNLKAPPFHNNVSSDGHGPFLVANQLCDSSGCSLPLPPGRKAPPAAPPPAPPQAPTPPPKPPAPSPPAPPKVARPPPVPLAKPLPRGARGRSSSGGDDDEGSHKARLKPFFWEKVQANPDDSMVWNDLKSGSFQVNEEMMESLFGYTPAEKSTNERRKETSESLPQYIKIIDPKKSQNLAILLKALNVTTAEVCDALLEGNELPVELVQTLLKMAPTAEEELKLRLFNGDRNQLGPAEQFLKVMVDIPFAFKRLESLLFMSTLPEEVLQITESLKTLEVASTELRNSRLFLKLLEAVLKTGNRMNDGTYRGGAQAFKLDTLLKLSDVKGTDGKTTLLHFVVQEIIRSEGIRAAKSGTKNKDLLESSPEYYRSLGLEVVSGLSSNLENVKRAAVVDGENLSNTVSKLHGLLLKNKKFLENEVKNLEEESGFKNILEKFIDNAEIQIAGLPEEEKRIMDMVKSTADYFHGNSGKDEGLRLFVIVRDFLVILDKVCKEVRNSTMIPKKVTRIENPLESPSSQSSHNNSFDARRKLFPAIMDRRIDGSSSDDDSSSP